jgi:NitT/TauT family transport system permease protein
MTPVRAVAEVRPEEATAAAEGNRASISGNAGEKTRRRIVSPARRKLETHALRLAFIALILVLWEIASDRWVPALMISRPTVIGQWIWKWTVDGTYLKNAFVTLEATALGFLAGASAGMIVGYITGSWRRLDDVVAPIMTAFYTMPRLALAPLFLLWFGLGMEFRVVFAATIVFFLVYYNTWYGVKEVNQELISAVRIMGANRMQLAARVIFPSALVWVTAGLKISVPYALVGVVVAEMLASNEGLGFLLARSAAQFSAAGTFAAIFALMVIALVLDKLLEIVTRRALQWRYTGLQSR